MIVMVTVHTQGGPKSENTAFCLLWTIYCLSMPQNCPRSHVVTFCPTLYSCTVNDECTADWLWSQCVSLWLTFYFILLIAVLLIVSISFAGLAVCLIIIFCGIGCARRSTHKSCLITNFILIAPGRQFGSVK